MAELIEPVPKRETWLASQADPAMPPRADHRRRQDPDDAGFFADPTGARTRAGSHFIISSSLLNLTPMGPRKAGPYCPVPNCAIITRVALDEERILEAVSLQR